MKNHYKEQKEEDLAHAIAKTIGYTFFAILMGAVVYVLFKVAFPA